MNSKAIILFAHGSRDALWRQPMDTVAARIQQDHPEMHVRCAFLELMAPDLIEAAAQVIAQGANEINITPMFLGMGRHVRHDLPLLIEQLKLAHPAVQFNLQAALGEDPRMLELMAKIAAQ